VVELGDRTLLVLGEGERQRPAVAVDQLAGRTELRRLCVLAVAPCERERELQLEQLVEREPAPPTLRVFLRPWTVDRDERVARDRKLEPGAQDRGQQVADVVGVRQRRLDERAQSLRRHVLARRVDRREVGGLGRLAEVVALDDEVVAAPLPAQADVRPRLKLVREPLLVEPHGVDVPALVLDARGDDRQSARAALSHAAHDARDRRLVLAEELGDLELGSGRLVAKGCVTEQIADRAQAELAEALRNGDADSGQDVQRALEPLGAGRRSRGQPATRRGDAGESR
jgi:hypothetical protein